MVLLPEVYFVGLISILLVYGAVRKKDVGSVSWLSLGGLVLGGLLNINNEVKEGTILNGSLYHDNMSVTGKALLLIFGGICLWVGKEYIKKEGRMEYPILVVGCSWGLGLMISAHDLIALYLALEMQSLGLYVLAAIKRESAYATEAGLKYFIMGAFSSGLLLFGSTLIYGNLGTTNFEDIGRLVMFDTGVNNMVKIGLLLVVVGILFKLAAAPFHMWSPDVYEGAPTVSTMFFAAVPKIGLIGLLIRLLYVSFYPMIEVWQGWLMFASISSMLIAALGALYQRRIKRFLAYSSIGHVAFLLMGLSCGTVEGVSGVLLYTLIYMVMSVCVWMVLIVFNERNGVYLEELVSVGKGNPWLAFTIAVTLFSMAGIPPLAGFFAKMYVFFASMSASMYGLAIIGVLTSVISAFYYLRWVKIIYFEGGPERGVSLEMSKGGSMIMAIGTLFMLWFCVNPSPFLLMAQNMVVLF